MSFYDLVFPNPVQAKIGFKNHYSIHSGLKPFKCDICGTAFRLLQVQLNFTRNYFIHHVLAWLKRKFNISKDMKRHKLIHLEVKPHKCPVPNCGKSFTRKAHLKDHLNKHTGAKPFSCSICQLAFSTSYQKRRHEKVEHQI